MPGMCVRRWIKYLVAGLILVSAAVRAQAPAATAPGVGEALVQLADDPTGAVALRRLRDATVASKNPADQALGLSVYYLGCLVAGVPDQARWAIENLNRAFPGGVHLKHLARERMMDVCAACKGVGTAEVDCRACAGSGECNLCKGKGHNIGLGGRELACTICGTSGECHTCKGKGKLTESCRVCAGQGGRLNKGKVLALYDLYLDGTEIEAIARELADDAKLAAPDFDPLKVDPKKEAPAPPKPPAPAPKPAAAPAPEAHDPSLPRNSYLVESRDRAVEKTHMLNERDRGKRQWVFKHDANRGKYIVFSPDD